MASAKTTVVRALVSAFLSAAFLVTPVFAATPVAVWDGDFTATQTGFTLNRSGNAISQDNSTITIDQSVGVKVDFTTGFSDAMTVMFKYSDLAFDAQKTLATSFCSGGDENRTGVYAASGGTINGIWNTADWAHPAQALSASSGVLAFCYSKAGGTSLYSVGASSRSELFNESGLRASGDTAINGCTIGGERAKGATSLLGAATDMKISGIAIFSGILTESEMTGYVWPSEIETVSVDANTTVSAINTLIAGVDASFKEVVVDVAGGVTINVDTAFVASTPTTIASEGNVTLSAAEQPAASYFSAVDFSGVKGALFRSWLTEPGVAGINFRSNMGTDASGALATCSNWIHDSSSANGSSTAAFTDGLTKITWASATTWSAGSGSILSGYLDDGWKNGNGAEVYISGVPYETYDIIIYCNSDSNPGTFRAKTVNGTTYTWDAANSAVVEGSGDWGKAALQIPVYGVNAMRIKNLTGSLTVYGLPRQNQDSKRGGIAAIQIMPPETPDNIRVYTLTLDGTDTTWSAGTWTLEGNPVEAPTSGYVEIAAAASTELTVDTAVSLADLKVSGGSDIVVNVANGENGSLYAIKATIKSGVFQQGSAAVLGATPRIVVEDGATFDLNGLAVNEFNAVSMEGDGSGSWPWALTSSGGEFPTGTLRGFTLTGDATIGGANKIGCGKLDVASYLGFGTYTLTKTGVGELSFTNIRSATDSEGTLDIVGGSVTLDQFTNLDGSNLDNNGRPWASTTVKIHSGASLESKVKDRWVWIGSLELAGGTISTTGGPFAIATAVTGAGTLDRVVFGSGATASLTGNLAVTGNMTLNGAMSFNKDSSAASDVVVSVSDVNFDAANTITIGDGVTLNDFASGTITCSDKNAIGNVANYLQSANWTGTFAISGVSNAGNLDLGKFGNENSSISFTSVTKAYLPNYNVRVGKVILTDNGDTPALELSNGYSSYCTTFSELAGTGTITNSYAPNGNTWMAQGLTINVMTNFTGKLALGELTVTFGTTSRFGKNSDGSGATEKRSYLFFDPDAVFSVDAGFSLWSPKGVVFNGPMDFKVSDDDWAAFTGGAESGATLKLLDNIGTNIDKFETSFGKSYFGPGMSVSINGVLLDRSKYAVKVSKDNGGYLYICKAHGAIFTLR